MKIHTVICVLCLATNTLAQSFHLVEESTGEARGPFTFRQGEKIKIGERSFRLVVGKGKPPSQEQQLRQTTIPQIDFRNAAIRDVVDFIRQASVDHSPWPVPHNKGVNIILKVKNEKALPKITFRASDLSLYETLNAVSEVSGLKMRSERNIIWIESR